MAYNPIAVANRFIDLSENSKHSVTPMKLQKLIYIAHGWHLAIHGHPLIDEPVEAWQYGPVISSVYHEFKHCGGGAIKEKGTTLQTSASRNPFKAKFQLIVPEINEGEDAHSLTRVVWNKYGEYTGQELSALTHKTDTPWDKAWNDKGVEQKRGIDISDDVIKQHYIELAQSHKKASA